MFFLVNGLLCGGCYSLQQKQFFYNISRAFWILRRGTERINKEKEEKGEDQEKDGKKKGNREERKKEGKKRRRKREGERNTLKVFSLQIVKAFRKLLLGFRNIHGVLPDGS